MYLLGKPTGFTPRAASDVFSTCGPSGQCNAYGWTDNNSYTKIPTKCYVALYKCYPSKWSDALQVGCQKSTNPSKNTAYYAEIHKLTSSNPDPSIWDKVVSGSNGNGYLKGFAPPNFCGVWQIDVGPPCNFSFHSGGNKTASMCQVQQTHNACVGMACTKVNGPGQNQCSQAGNNPAPQCTHKACRNQQCVLVAGGSQSNSCSNNNDCLIPTPTFTPIPTPTRTPTPRITPPTSCPVPSQVQNVRISCPLCNQR